MRVILVSVVALLLVLSTAGLLLGSVSAPNTGTQYASSAHPTAPLAPIPASGTIALTPSVFVDVNTLVTPSGGTFGAGATVRFCIGSSVAGPWAATLGSVALPAGQVTLASPTQVQVTFSGATMNAFLASSTSATGFVAAMDSALGCGGSGATYAGPASVNVFSSSVVNPQLAISPSPVLPHSSASVTLSSGAFDPNATLTLYLGYPASSSVLATYTLTAAGQFPAGAGFTVPSYLAQGSVAVVAQETSGPGGSVLVGLTSDGSMTIAPTVSVSPFVINGALGASLAISGLGFVAGSTIAANTITAGGVGTHNPSITVSSAGAFNVSVTLASAISSPGGPESVSVPTTPVSSISVFPSAFFVSNPNPGNLRFSFSPSGLTPNQAVSAEAWNFPADASVTVLVGSTMVGTASANALGYAALPSGTLLPGIPAGS